MLTPFNIRAQGGIASGFVAPTGGQVKKVETQIDLGSQDQVSIRSETAEPISFPASISCLSNSPVTPPVSANDNPKPSTQPTNSGFSLPKNGKPGPFNTKDFDFNNPLPMLESEQIDSLEYTHKLGQLNVRYPGLTVKLKAAEARAWIVSNAAAIDNDNPSPHTTAVLKNPPWPNESVGSSRERIQHKALELQALNPKLVSNRVEDYDFEQAKDKAEDLFAILADLFPEKEFEGAQFATRAKTPQSLEAKLTKRTTECEGFSLAHLTDSVGARIDCRSLKMLGDAAGKLEKHFEGKIVAKDDYLSRPGALGYRALHYVVDLGDRMAEIQLSTHDLRATDLATHDTLYKPFFQIDEGTAKKLQGSADRVMEAESFRCLCGYR